jgi:hypothetical protein
VSRITTLPLNQIASSRSGTSAATSYELVGRKAVVAIAVNGRENGWLIVSIRTVIVGWTTVSGVRQPN